MKLKEAGGDSSCRTVLWERDRKQGRDRRGWNSSHVWKHGKGATCGWEVGVMSSGDEDLVKVFGLIL